MDRFDKLAGIYVYCADYHEGQNSKLYRLMSRIDMLGIHLSDNAWTQIREGGDEWFDAHCVYKACVDKYQSL